MLPIEKEMRVIYAVVNGIRNDSQSGRTNRQFQGRMIFHSEERPFPLPRKSKHPFFHMRVISVRNFSLSLMPLKIELYH